jgi:chromosome segregation ATPase
MELQIKGPDYRRKIDRDLTLLQEKFEKCLNLKPIHSQLQDLEDKDIPTLKTQMKQLDKEIVQLKNKQTDIEQELNDKICLPLEQCEQIKTDIIMLNKYINERKDFESKINICQQKLGKCLSKTSSCRMLTKQNSEFCRLMCFFPLNSTGVYRILREFFHDF